MRFLKQKNISKYSPSDNAFTVIDVRRTDPIAADDPSLGLPAGTNLSGGRAIIDVTGGLRLPKGTTDQRPRDTGVRTPNGADGFIRYNTTTNSIEARLNGIWEVVKAPGATAITKQTINGALFVDGIETTFSLSQEPPSEDSIIVLVENVFQISDTNFNLSYDHLGVIGDTKIIFTSPPPLGKDITIYYGFAN